MAERRPRRGRRRLADEDPQQGRLARAVEAEHEQPLAAADVERTSSNTSGPPYALAQPVDLEHDPPGVRRRRASAPAACARAAGAVDPRGLDAVDALVEALGLRARFVALAPNRSASV